MIFYLTVPKCMKLVKKLLQCFYINPDTENSWKGLIRKADTSSVLLISPFCQVSVYMCCYSDLFHLGKKVFSWNL